MHIAKVSNRDKEYVFKWLRHIWGERDYIPHIWDRWMEEGDLLAVYDDDKAIAIWHIKWIGDYAWFEGMRVKPEYQGIGIAKMANKYSINLARNKGCKQALLATMINNKPAQRSLESVGFKKIAAYTMVKLDSTVYSYYGANVATLDWEKFKSDYPNLKRNNYIIAWEESPWVFLPVNKREFMDIKPEKRIKLDSAVALVGGETIIDEKYLYIRYLDTHDEDSLKNILGLTSQIAMERGLRKIFLYLPYNKELLNMAGKLLEVDETNTFLIYSVELRT